MKLEKFKKYGVGNKKIICSIIGITIIIGMFILFKSFAFFESKYDFDVIKGRIPPFNVSDVTLAFTVDGVKGNTLPSKDSYVAKSVTCQNGVTAEWNNDLWGLFNINANGKDKISCNIDFGMSLYKVVNVGDYVSYTPSKTSYTIPSSLTGYSSDQTINPSELELWRVIRKNEIDKTIEMVSEYTSSSKVYMKGVTGYNNAIALFDKIAKQYETSGITSGSRFMNSTTDTDLIKEVIGKLDVYSKGTETNVSYWLRDLYSSVHQQWNFKFYAIREWDYRGYVSYQYMYRNSGDEYWDAAGDFIRIVVTLSDNCYDFAKSIQNGTKSLPWKIN